MENWSISRDVLMSIRHIAHDWVSGVVIIKPFDGDFIILAVIKVDPYSPSNNIHNTTITGKDITMAIQQKLNVAQPTGGTSVITYIDNIKEVQTWIIPHTERWYWLIVNDNM
jgi:hypothetical protein